MIKKLQKLTVLTIMLLAWCSAYAYDFVADGMYFNLISLSDKTCQFTKGDNPYSGDIVIPEQVNYEGLTLTVKSLDNTAFNKQITGLTIPGTIDEIPAYSISKCMLTKLVICDSPAPLKNYDQVSIQRSIESFLYGQPVETVYLGRELSPNSNFSYIPLSSIEFGEYVKTLPIITHCSKLETLYIPDNITNMKGGGISNCESLKVIYIGNGLTELNTDIRFNDKLERIYIGNNLTTLQSSRLSDNKSLKGLYITSGKINTVTSLIDIPKSLPYINVPDPEQYQNLFQNFELRPLLDLNDSNIQYSGSLPEFSYFNNVYGSEVSINTTDANQECGSYRNTLPTTFTIGEWSSTADVPFTYTITPAPLFIVANNISKTYGSENPELTCSFLGFKNGETKDVLTKQPVLETTATTTSAVGTYPIIPSGAEAKNYTISYERGTLTVTKANQEIIWNQDFADAKVGDIVELNAIASSGLPVKYTSTDESIAEIFTQNGKKCVEFLKAGNVSIRANQEGNENYNEADRVNKTITIGQAEIAATSIEISDNYITIKDGQQYQLYATVLPENATFKDVTWESEDASIASVDANGLVTGVSEGNTMIIASCGDLKAECEVNVSISTGIDNASFYTSDTYDVFTIEGIQLRSHCKADELKALPKGIYIIKSESSTFKIRL